MFVASLKINKLLSRARFFLPFICIKFICFYFSTRQNYFLHFHKFIIRHLASPLWPFLNFERLVPQAGILGSAKICRKGCTWWGRHRSTFQSKQIFSSGESVKWHRRLCEQEGANPGGMPPLCWPVFVCRRVRQERERERECKRREAPLLSLVAFH